MGTNRNYKRLTRMTKRAWVNLMILSTLFKIRLKPSAVLPHNNSQKSKPKSTKWRDSRLPSPPFKRTLTRISRST